MPNVYRSKVKVGGTWYTVSATYVKVNGTWTAATGVYTKVGGAWKAAYPYPLSADASLTNLAVNGTPVSNGGTYNISYTTGTTVTISATLAAGATATGLGSTSVSYANNPNTKTIVVTAENGTSTATYTVNIQVAAQPTVTVYYKYCNSSSTTTFTSGSYTDTTTTSATTACNNRYAQLGYPYTWQCGASVPPDPDCLATCVSCCQDTGSFTCVTAGVGRIKYTWAQYDPCCGRTCADRIYYVDNASCISQ